MCRSAIKKKNHRFFFVWNSIESKRVYLASSLWYRWKQSSFSICLLVSSAMVIFLGCEEGYYSIYELPWRPCLDSKLWTKSRSDIKRAFGTQIISRPESCCCCLNNVNKKVDRKMRMENGVEEEGIVNAKASFISKRNHRSCKKRLNWRYCLSLEQ